METLSTQELTQKLYELIESNVSDAFERNDMFNIVDELESRLQYYLKLIQSTSLNPNPIAMDKETETKINTLIRYATQVGNIYLKNELKQIKRNLKKESK